MSVSYESPKHLPPSVVGWFDALLVLPIIVGMFFVLRSSAIISDAVLVVVLVATLGVTMGVIEIMRAPWRSKPRVPRRLTDILGSMFIKLTGFVAALLLVAFAYWLFPEYDRTYYAKYFESLFLVLPFLPLIVVPYFFYVEWRLPLERGGAWEMGNMVLGRGVRDWNTIHQYLLAWIVKGYFLPIMVGDVVNAMARLRGADWGLFSGTFVDSFDLLFVALINLELIFVAAGYLFTCRLFDSHVRAVEKTFFGWVIALMSYGPFLSLFYVRYLAYNTDGINWLSWLAGHEVLTIAWGSLILVLLVIHLWSDACFGLRFSNLTHRGIITNGPYRFSKHPAYVIKNIRWWLVSVPFIAVDVQTGLQLSLLLFCVNIVYSLRSYAEERMLSQDPVYIQYALWMDDHGVLRWVGRLAPFLSYRWRLEYWQRNGSPYLQKTTVARA